jgi:eukaryotic-like serine/threonine-protein kinase
MLLAMTVLRAGSIELLDLAAGSPALVEALSGAPTGVRLMGYLGGGGMSAVFHAERDLDVHSRDLSPATPRRIAIKIMRPDVAHELASAQIDPLRLLVKEAVALGRVMERKPPTEFVVGFFGCGRASVSIAGDPPRLLPWLAIEWVDGGSAGTSLSDRVTRAVDGVDPIRTMRLVRGIVEGVRVLHAEQIVHRDLKPDNILVAGPVDDETPKLADCGVARIDGMRGLTIAAMTPDYGGPEQALSMMTPGEPNPLVGPWTDVHALAAVVWFIVGGEAWARTQVDPAWRAGERRSLRTASRLHPGFISHPALLGRLDEVLARGAAPRLGAAAWEKDTTQNLRSLARATFPAMFVGPERYADVEALVSDLYPVLEAIEAGWVARAARQRVVATAFRSTQLPSSDAARSSHAPVVQVRSTPGLAVDGTNRTLSEMEAIEPGNVVFQPDGKLLARLGDGLVYFVDGHRHKVQVPSSLRSVVAQTRWVVRGPAGGFALIGPATVLLIRGGRMSLMPVPVRSSGEPVGEIQAAVGDGRLFGIVTAETDESNGGPELWRSIDGTRWGPPTVLPLGGDAHALAHGPYGLLVTGSRRGSKARALFVGVDEQTTVFTVGVNDKPPLAAVTASAGRECWAAGKGVVLRFDRSSAVAETIDTTSVPTAMALDLVGVPWLVTEQGVFRRHTIGGEALWLRYFENPEPQVPLVGIGFTPTGATVIDARGRLVHLEPADVRHWQQHAGVEARPPG